MGRLIQLFTKNKTYNINYNFLELIKSGDGPSDRDGGIDFERYLPPRLRINNEYMIFIEMSTNAMNSAPRRLQINQNTYELGGMVLRNIPPGGHVIACIYGKADEQYVYDNERKIGSKYVPLFKRIWNNKDFEYFLGRMRFAMKTEKCINRRLFYWKV